MIQADVQGQTLHLETAPTLFSPRGIDAGTLAMLAHVEFSPDDKVLDLGCGYGVIGIHAAKCMDPTRVYMLDNDPEAVTLARTNAASNSVAVSVASAVDISLFLFSSKWPDDKPALCFAV